MKEVFPAQQANFWDICSIWVWKLYSYSRKNLPQKKDGSTYSTKLQTLCPRCSTVHIPPLGEMKKKLHLRDMKSYYLVNIGRHSKATVIAMLEGSIQLVWDRVKTYSQQRQRVPQTLRRHLWFFSYEGKTWPHWKVLNNKQKWPNPILECSLQQWLGMNKHILLLKAWAA